MSQKKPKKILLYVGSTGYIGGPILNAIEVGKVLKKAGAEVIIATLSKKLNPELLKIIKREKIELVNTSFNSIKFSKIRNIYAMVTWLVKIRPRSQDVVVCMGHGGFHYFMQLFVKTRGYLIHRETGPGGHKVPKKSFFFYKYLENVKGVLALSETSKFYIKRDWPVSAPVKVIPEIIPNLTNGLQRKMLMEDAPIVHVGYLGRVERSKGVFQLVKMWSQLNIGSAVLHIHGDGPDIPIIKDYINSCGLNNKIILEGPYMRSRLHEILPKLDLFLLLSESEGLPAVLIEALAFGVPFVATDVGLIKDLAKGNKDVSVVECNDEAIKAGIEKMIRRIRNREINPLTLQQYYKERFCYEVVADRWRKALLKSEEFWCRDKIVADRHD